MLFFPNNISTVQLILSKYYVASSNVCLQLHNFHNFALCDACEHNILHNAVSLHQEISITWYKFLSQYFPSIIIIWPRAPNSTNFSQLCCGNFKKGCQFCSPMRPTCEGSLKESQMCSIVIPCVHMQYIRKKWSLQKLIQKAVWNQRIYTIKTQTIKMQYGFLQISSLWHYFIHFLPHGCTCIFNC